MDGWNATFLLGFGLFSGAMLVSGRVTNCNKIAPPKNELLFQQSWFNGKMFHVYNISFLFIAWVRIVHEKNMENWGSQPGNLQSLWLFG